MKSAPTTNETARLFYALWPDEATRAALQRLQNGLHGRLTRSGDLHITLAFLGQQPLTSLPLLKKILGDLPQTEIALQINNMGYFKRKRIVWAGMGAAPDALIDLQMSLTKALEQAKITFDKSSHFKPHVTLARDADAPLDVPFDLILWQAKQVVLVQSENQNGRNIYRILETQHLVG